MNEEVVDAINQVQMTTGRHTKDEEYEFDITINAKNHHQRYTEELLPAIKEKTSLLRLKPGGETLPQDDASPHTGKDTVKLNRSKREDKGKVKLMTQPAHSSDLGITDVGFFASPKSRVWVVRFDSSEYFTERVRKMFYVQDSETLERIWQSLFVRYSQVLRKLGEE